MKRSLVVFTLLIAWIVGGCAVNTPLKKAARTPRVETPDTARAKPVDTPTISEPAGCNIPPAETEAGSGAVKKPLARKAPAALTIYFKANSNELDPSEIAKLDKVAETLQRNPMARATLNGYTDSAGSKAYNLMVAESRASSVKFYLVAKGIDPGRMAIVAKGASEFAGDNDTDEGRNLNRRVEIKIQNKK